MVDFKAKLKDVPSNPGVYLMNNSDGGIIYVGKAKNLKKRLSSYFINLANRPVKVQAMLEHVDDFRYIICASEIDALMLENNLIKKNNPKYNILLKDDKAYPFLKIDLKEKYPTIQMVRTLKKDGAKYFGPYMQGVSYSDILDLIYTAFKVRDCSRDLSKPSRPCLNMHLEKCIAPCTGNVSEEEYHNEIKKVMEFLKGNDKEIERILKEKMLFFSDLENYEVALNYKKKLDVLHKIISKQVSSLPQDFNLDFFTYETNGIISAVNIHVVRAGKLLGSDNIIVETCDEDLSSFIMQYYLNNEPLCDEIITDMVEDSSALEEWICNTFNKKIRITVPKQGVKMSILQLAHSNAKDAVVKYGDKEEKRIIRTTGAVSQLKDLLKLKNMPNRIECFDISHISGTDKVASMVVFEGGVSKKSHYRKFKIKTVEGNNDFACMAEVLKRRLLRLGDKDESFSSRPDLLLIDGGKGQLSYAMEVQKELGLTDIEIASIAERDEWLYVGSNPKEAVILSKDSVALQLVQRVRDEAHRFAITFHRSLREKHLSETKLTQIEGVGEKTAIKLLKEFGSVEDIKRSSIEKLSSVNGISENLATKILEFLNS